MIVDELENVRSLATLTSSGADHHAHRRGLTVTEARKKAGEGGGSSAALLDGNTTAIDRSKAWRTMAYVRAGVEILEAQYPILQHHYSNHRRSQEDSASQIVLHHNHSYPVLTPSAEQALIQSICDIVKPPKKPLKLKVFMRRAPTQEEFFRGSLSRNPILISSLKVDSQRTSSSGTSDDEPRVKDLRQHIANDLQMADSAELLELLVANKILDLNLKLRVVAQTVWKNHVLENTSSVHSESGFRQLMSGSLSESGLISRSRFDENTPMSALPPMVVTYRLAGVDCEATEDNVEEGDVVDPDAPLETNTSSAEHEKKMEKEYGITRIIMKGRGVGVLLRSLEAHLGQIIKRIRRDDVGRRSAIGGKLVMKNNRSRSHFLKCHCHKE